MSKFSVGNTFTVWVDVEADTEEEAIAKANKVHYFFEDIHDTGAEMELNEFDDPIVVAL